MEDFRSELAIFGFSTKLAHIRTPNYRGSELGNLSVTLGPQNLRTAVEYKDRHNFPRHLKAGGAPHTGPGIRFLCNSDAIDDPDNRGHWFLLTPVPARTL